jgi:hypothetical protein
MKTSGNSMLVLYPGGRDPVEFFSNSMWKESLERHAIATYFFGAPKGWRTMIRGFEIEAATKVLAEMRSMEYFPCTLPAFLLHGLWRRSEYCLCFFDNPYFGAGGVGQRGGTRRLTENC